MGNIDLTQISMQHNLDYHNPKCKGYYDPFTGDYGCGGRN